MRISPVLQQFLHIQAGGSNHLHNLLQPIGAVFFQGVIAPVNRVTQGNVGHGILPEVRPPCEGQLLDAQKFETAVLALLRAAPSERFARARGVSEGLENRLAAAVREAESLEELYTRLKTKRYPHARLRRLVLDASLEFPAELPEPPYLLVLGARKAVLPRLKQAWLPAGTSLAYLMRNGEEARKIGALHSRAVDFSSLCRCKIRPMGLAFTAKPVIL